MKRLLVVANDFPFPPTHGAAVDMWNRILILREMNYIVDLLVSVKETPSEERIQSVKNHVDNLWLVPRQGDLKAALSLIPFQVCSRMSLKDIQLDQQFDGIILEADYVAPFLSNPAARNSKIILRIHNEQVSYFRELAQGSNNWLRKIFYYSESFKFRFFSSSVMKKCDLLWFISDSEREEHARKNPCDARKSFFLPTHVNPKELRSQAVLGKTALFVGTLTISHNADSVEWYIKNVHPLLSDLDGYRFQFAGRTAGQPIPRLKDLVDRNANVFLEEDPITLDEIYAKAGVFVNPVIRGAGIKIKVVQAIQAGLPVVSTSMGIEGTGFKDAIHVLVADTPEDFASCVRKVLLEPGLAESLVLSAQKLLRERYDMGSSMQKTLSSLIH